MYKLSMHNGKKRVRAELAENVAMSFSDIA